MNIQKKDRKQEFVHKDRGDMIRRHKKELQTVLPRDRGDVKIRRSRKAEELRKAKSEKAESKASEFVSRSTNTLLESSPLSFGNLTKCEEDNSEKCGVDFRKRIKNRYTFRPQQKERKDGDISKFNYIMQYDVKNELPKASNFESPEKQKPKESPDVKKKPGRVKEMYAVHRAVSPMKLKPTKPMEHLAERKKDVDKEKFKNSFSKDKHRNPVIKTITSKIDTVRDYKAVTFVDNVQRKPLHIITLPCSRVKIPSKDPKPKKSTIPIPVDTKTAPKRILKRFVKAKLVRSPSSKSADSLTTEVAQWVPESIDQHTKPYYEAWVDKTATASVKYSKEEMASVKSKVLKALKLEKSPELVYQRLAGSYAGRIRVRKGKK